MSAKWIALFVLGSIENRGCFYHWVRAQRVRAQRMQNQEPVTHMHSTYVKPAWFASYANLPCDEYMVWDSSMLPFVQEQICRFGCVSLSFEV